jgi:alpha-L-fucosidase
VREFVDACRENGLIPFFYHTLLDWHHPDYDADFPAYLKYLRASVEILCTNYGKIGGIWFDGMWDKPEEDWQEDALYGLIRSYQKDAMIINNTGLNARGALGHIELDSVTFERGRPQPINLSDSPKYIASEMCETFADHWGYAENDFNFKPTAELIQSLAICRRYRSNFLFNVGPKADGSLRTIDKGALEILGQWTALNAEALYEPEPVAVEVENKPKNFLLKKGNNYYLFLFDISMRGDGNVAINKEMILDNTFSLPETVQSVCWLDSGKPLQFTQTGDRVTVTAEPYRYGQSFVVRVAKITV